MVREIITDIGSIRDRADEVDIQKEGKMVYVSRQAKWISRWVKSIARK